MSKVETFTLVVYRKKRTVFQRFTATGTARQVREDAARLLGYLGARRVTIRTLDGRCLAPVRKAAPVRLESLQTAE